MSFDLGELLGRRRMRAARDCPRGECCLPPAAGLDVNGCAIEMTESWENPENLASPEEVISREAAVAALHQGHEGAWEVFGR